jgi:hypothetical protein
MLATASNIPELMGLIFAACALIIWGLCSLLRS